MDNIPFGMHDIEVGLYFSRCATDAPAALTTGPGMQRKCSGPNHELIINKVLNMIFMSMFKPKTYIG